MWNGKIRPAMYAYNLAMTAEVKKDFAGLKKFLTLTYKLYKTEIDKVKDMKKVPPHWFKNFALIHPKLVSVGKSKMLKYINRHRNGLN